MTIAIGMLCSGGAIIAADTNVVLTDGTRRKGVKAFEIPDAGGRSIVLANATEDGDAANTLIADLIDEFGRVRFNDERHFKKLLTQRMTEWRAGYGQAQAPELQLVVAAPFARDTGLYFCSPPNTIRRCSESEGYIGIGAGARITDSIYRLLFRVAPHASPGSALRFLCYMMYRAKKENALLADSDTTAFVLMSSTRKAVEVIPYDLRGVEKMMHDIDWPLECLAIGLLANEQKDFPVVFKNFVEVVITGTDQFKNIVIRDKDGNQFKP